MKGQMVGFVVQGVWITVLVLIKMCSFLAIVYVYVITPYECYVRFIITEYEGEVIIILL